MLAWARRIADGQWPYRDFWANYAPGPAGAARRAGQALRPVAAVVAHRARRDRRDRLRARLRLRAPARRARAGRWARGLAVAGAMAWPSGPGPTRRRSRSRSARCWPRAGRRWPRARWPAWRSSCGPEIGVAAALGAALEARARRGAGAARASRARSPRGRRGARARALRHRRRRRHGRPGARLRLACRTSSGCPSRWTTTAASTSNKLLEFYLPAILVAGSALWAAWALARRERRRAGAAGRRSGRLPARPHRRVPPRAAVGRPRRRAGCAAGRERARACRGPRWASCWRSSPLHGVERRVGQALHPPALAAHPAPRRPTACAPRRPTPPRCAR